MSRRTLLFLLILVACVVGVGLYVHLTLRERAAAEAEAAASAPLPAIEPGASPDGPFIIFARQSGSPDGRDRSLGIAWPSRPTDARFEEALRCDRVDMSGGRGLCLVRRGRFPVSYAAVIFDETFAPTGELPLAGAPSRTQVSPGGRYGATTVFVAGHAYTDAGFSTRTSIIDLATGAWLVEDMESRTVRRDGRALSAVDFNFWGITFARDERTFYMTLGTGGRTYLVRGLVDSDVLEVVGDDVECPSLSPDNTRIAFKHRVDGGIGPVLWNVWVLDLASGARHGLAESRSVDDQVQWLDDGRVMYSLPGDRPAVMDTWVVPADGTGQPALFLPSSYSAAVVTP